MDFSLEIHIPPSRSPSAKEVLKYAEKTGYYDRQSGTLTFSSLVSIWSFWDVFSFIHWTAQKWSGFFIKINGRMILPHRNDIFYSLQNIRHCVFSNSDSKDLNFCARGCFGCRQLRTIKSVIGSGCWDYQLWYRYGNFGDNVQIWYIDRQAILSQLLYEAREMLVLYCPEFSVSRVTDAVNQLPEKIVLDDSWEVEYEVRIGANGIESVPVNIRCLYELDSVEPIGRVRPVGKPDEKDENEINRFLDNLLKQRKRK